jgi:hypothetical protein
MNRGLLAPLSPNEELALRRIAYGNARLRDTDRREVKHLMALNLIVSDEITVSITKLGLERLTHLPHLGTGESTDRDKHITAIAEALGLKKR